MGKGGKMPTPIVDAPKPLVKKPAVDHPAQKKDADEAFQDLLGG